MYSCEMSREPRDFTPVITMRSSYIAGTTTNLTTRSLVTREKPAAKNIQEKKVLMLAYHGTFMALGIIATIVAGPSGGALTVKSSGTIKCELIDVVKGEPAVTLELAGISRGLQCALDPNPDRSFARAFNDDFI